MGKNEIRIRRNMMTTGRIAQHRNYSELMRQHNRDTKLKRIFRVFVYFLIILFITLILIIVIRWEKRQSQKTPTSKVEMQSNASITTSSS